jgi:hypothetical protein
LEKRKKLLIDEKAVDMSDVLDAGIGNEALPPRTHVSIRLVSK